MEQQWNQAKTPQETERRDRAEWSRRRPERKRLGHAGQTARAVLEGASLWKFPPSQPGGAGPLGAAAMVPRGVRHPQKPQRREPEEHRTAMKHGR